MSEPLNRVRGRKRNAKKNRSSHALTSHLRNRPVTGQDFDDLKAGKFSWHKKP